MAFDKEGFSKISESSSLSFSPIMYSYKLLTDTLATIKGSAYFNSKAINLTINDPLYIVGSDGADIVKVTAVSPDVTVSSILADLPPGSVELADLASGIAPSHVVKFGGLFTTAGGDVNESITVTGALATDLAFVVLSVAGASPETIITSKAATDAIDVVFSGDPSTDHVVTYQVLRAAV